MTFRPTSYQIVTPPSSEPVLLADVKAHLRIDDTASDTLLDGMIIAARQACEEYTSLALMEQTWALWLDQWPSEFGREWWDGIRDGAMTINAMMELRLSKPPLKSVDHIKTYAMDGTPTTYDPDNYFVDTVSNRIVITSGAAPSGSRLVNSIEIQFVCGEADPADLPAPIIEGIKRHVAYQYEHRGDELITQDSQDNDYLQSVPVGIQALWQPYRVFTL